MIFNINFLIRPFWKIKNVLIKYYYENSEKYSPINNKLIIYNSILLTKDDNFFLKFIYKNQ
jgi:hypothetical protein